MSQSPINERKINIPHGRKRHKEAPWYQIENSQEIQEALSQMQQLNQKLDNQTEMSIRGANVTTALRTVSRQKEEPSQEIPSTIHSGTH